MFCKNEWNLEFMHMNFTKTFMSKTYKQKKEKILLEREKAMLPETQQRMEEEKKRQEQKRKENKHQSTTEGDRVDQISQKG